METLLLLTMHIAAIHCLGCLCYTLSFLYAHHRSLIIKATKKVPAVVIQ